MCSRFCAANFLRIANKTPPGNAVAMSVLLTAPPPVSVRRRWVSVAFLATVGALVGAFAAFWYLAPFSPRQAHQRRLEIRAALASPDPQTRKRAAWRTIAEPDPFTEVAMTQAVMGAESDADVREACVYALGRIGKPENFAAVEFAIDLDPTGLVRASAWVSATRIDPEHTRRLIESAKPGDKWDHLGVAHARLLLGDLSDVDALLTLALDDDWGIRCAAGAALQRGLRPYLEAVGRWPLEAQPATSEPWPAELVAEIRRRCAGLDLKALAIDTAPRIEEARRAKRGIEKVKTARERISAWLFSQPRHSLDE